ncbi:hypothetical protein DFH05DRAFT_1546263 [Lentinula detonsa]|uniref:Uncharacterized protein n=1 Tax=Lentinula detonsa TaxID=2804962 RepID=A0A9W8NSE8_9AGAR|nr:hypothetical protein DFH05DRAFT_1546263 [Lentinula detonsa]
MLDHQDQSIGGSEEWAAMERVIQSSLCSANDSWDREAAWSTMYLLSASVAFTPLGMILLTFDTLTQAGNDISPNNSFPPQSTSSPSSLSSDATNATLGELDITTASLTPERQTMASPGERSQSIVKGDTSPETQRSIKPLPRRVATRSDENTCLRPVTPAFGISFNFTPLSANSPLLPSDRSNTVAAATTNKATSYVDVKHDPSYFRQTPYTPSRSSLACDDKKLLAADDTQLLQAEEYYPEYADEDQNELEQEEEDDDDEKMEFDWDAIREIEDEDEYEEEEEFQFGPAQWTLSEKTEEEEEDDDDDDLVEVDIDENGDEKNEEGETELDAYDELDQEDLVFPMPVKCEWMYQVAKDAPLLPCNFPARSVSEAKVHARRHARNNAIKPSTENEKSAVWCRWHGCDFLEKHKLDEFVTHYSVHLLMAARDAFA